MRFRRVEVMTIPDEQGHLLPETFMHEGLEWTVEEVLDRWYEGGSPGRPEVRYFKIRTGDGSVFILRHAALFDAWGVLEKT